MQIDTSRQSPFGIEFKAVFEICSVAAAVVDRTKPSVKFDNLDFFTPGDDPGCPGNSLQRVPRFPVGRIEERAWGRGSGRDVESRIAAQYAVRHGLNVSPRKAHRIQGILSRDVDLLSVMDHIN